MNFSPTKTYFYSHTKLSRFFFHFIHHNERPWINIDITCVLFSLNFSKFIPIFNVMRVPVMSMSKDFYSTHMEINALRRLWRFRSLLTFLSFCLYVPSWCDDNANTPVFLFYRTTFLVFYTLRVFFAMHRLKKDYHEN